MNRRNFITKALGLAGLSCFPTLLEKAHKWTGKVEIANNTNFQNEYVPMKGIPWSDGIDYNVDLVIYVIDNKGEVFLKDELANFLDWTPEHPELPRFARVLHKPVTTGYRPVVKGYYPVLVTYLDSEIHELKYRQTHYQNSDSMCAQSVEFDAYDRVPFEYAKPKPMRRTI